VELDDRLRGLVRDWRATPPDLRDLLRIGAYQLMHLSRIPAYAAVQATVAAAKRVAGPRGAGLVNAILRRLVTTPGSAPSPGLSSHPAWLVTRWTRRYGAERAEALVRHNDGKPPLTLQPLGWTAATLAQALTARGIAHRAAPSGRGLVVEAHGVRDLPGYAEGGFIVQDAAQALLLAQAQFPAGALVWDACAAPGGKTAVLAGHARVVASDGRPARVARLRDTLRRTRRRVPVLVTDARSPAFAATTFDGTLVDAPCSATGAFRRHPDARWRLTPRHLRRFAALQAALLDGVAPVVKPGGLLAYLTCSLEPEENEEQVNAFLDRHPEYERDGEDRLVFPPDLDSDGGYASRLRRRR
jgi:16S rRNA (cytosine967-C5)-methyltransferase